MNKDNSKQTINKNEYRFRIMLKDVKKSWINIIKDFCKEYPTFKTNIKKIEHQRKKIKNKYMIFPFPENVFNTFKYFDLDQTKVVLLGQDPYHSYEKTNNIIVPQAMGLSFSVPKNFKVPSSLKNIYKELKSDLNIDPPNHGDIIRWTKEENILLLNTALTVVEGNPKTHINMWNKFTDYVIKYISNNTKGVVFILLGGPAKKKRKLIDKKNHKIVEAVHPSGLSAHRGFFGSKIFSKTNVLLKELGKKEINWSIE